MEKYDRDMEEAWHWYGKSTAGVSEKVRFRYGRSMREVWKRYRSMEEV